MNYNTTAVLNTPGDAGCLNSTEIDIALYLRNYDAGLGANYGYRPKQMISETGTLRSET